MRLRLQVREAMESAKVDLLYQINAKRLRELQPDIILSQGLCSVCSIDVQTVERVCKKMVPEPTVVNVSPENLDGVLASVLQIGKAVGMETEAVEVEKKLRGRVRRAVEQAGRARTTRIAARTTRIAPANFTAGEASRSPIRLALCKDTGIF